MWDRDKPLRPYALRIARNLMIDAFRARMRDPSPHLSTNEGLTPLVSAERAEGHERLAALVRAALELLPAEERAVMVRYRGALGDETLEEIAKDSGAAVATVYRRKERAFAQLKEFFERHKASG